MDYSGSITNGRPAATTSEPDLTATELGPDTTNTRPAPATPTSEPGISTTANPTTDPSSTSTTTTTTNDGMTSDTSSIIVVPTTTTISTISTISTTTSYIETTTSSTTTPIDPTTTPRPSTTTTPPPPNPTTTTPPPPITKSTTKDIATSTPIPIVTVTTSGTVVRTYTSISYSNYTTHIATALPTSDEGKKDGSANVGAIAGGVVGGVAAIAIIGFVIILLAKRRRNKHKESPYESEHGGGTGGMGSINPHPFGNDYNTYGTPTVISDNNSQPSSRPLSMSAAPSQGIKPRPFVQAYNPAYDDQQQYAGYDGAHSPPQDRYYNDYQAYNNNYNANAYSHDAYYAQQQEPMIPVSSSATGLSTNNGRNVPDENDYDLSRKVSRHVPDEISSVPHTR